MSKTTNFFLAYITTKNEEEALTLANFAVEKNLAACGNIFPKMKSVYKWNKKLQNDNIFDVEHPWRDRQIVPF